MRPNASVRSWATKSSRECRRLRQIHQRPDDGVGEEGVLRGTADKDGRPIGARRLVPNAFCHVQRSLRTFKRTTDQMTGLEANFVSVWYREGEKTDPAFPERP